MNKKIIIGLLLIMVVGGIVFLVGNQTENPSYTPSPTLPETGGKDYKCPSGWVDCMPGPGERHPICNDKEYQRWARENCPEFKGIAM